VAATEPTMTVTTSAPTTTPPPPVRTETTLRVPGHADRPTILQLATDPAAPLLVVFHGQNGSIENIKERSDLPDVAWKDGVSLLWLSGKPVPKRSWNTRGSCCEPAHSAGVDDKPYVRAALVAARSAGARPATLVTTGVSNGGGMAVEVACTMNEEFDGAVSVAGWNPVGCTGGDIALLVIGGTEDAKLGAARARSMASSWVRNVVSCTGKPERIVEGIATVTSWTACARGRLVRLVELDGVGHEWPRFDDYDATVDMVEFARALD
jgi:polyhydroxybutyrate depolymerase